MEQNLKSRINFPVIKVPHQLDIAEYKGDAGVSILRADKNEIISNMSSNYQLVPHENILSAVEAVLESNKVQYEIKDIYTYSTGNTSMRARYILTGKEFPAVGGALYPMIDVNNSYDGLSRFHCAYGIWRKICSNGAMGLDGTKYDRIHIKENIQLDGLFYSIDTWLTQKLPMLVHNVNVLENSESISLEHFEKFLKPNELKELLVSGVYDKNMGSLGDTAWAQMNALTEFAQTLINTDRRLFIEEKAMRFVYEHIN